jgi:hypothetical protein
MPAIVANILAEGNWVFSTDFSRLFQNLRANIENVWPLDSRSFPVFTMGWFPYDEIQAGERYISPPQPIT